MKVFKPKSTGFKELFLAELYYKEYAGRCSIFVYEDHCNGLFFSIEDALKFSMNNMIADETILLVFCSNITCETAKLLLQCKALVPSTVYYYQKRGNKFNLLHTKYL